MIRELLTRALGPSRKQIEAQRPSLAQRIARLDADLDRQLAARKADRRQRQQVARDRESAKRHAQFQRDRLLNDQVAL